MRIPCPAAYWCQRVELSNYSDVSQASWFTSWRLLLVQLNATNRSWWQVLHCTRKKTMRQSATFEVLIEFLLYVVG
jgi:hypothetical protein